MKKILSVLIGVLIGVSSMYGATHNLTIKGYAIGEGIPTNQYGGGTITLMGKSAIGEGENSNTYTTDGPKTEASITIQEKSGGLLWWAWEQEALLKLDATADPNYVFEGFTQENSLTPSSWLSQSSPHGDFVIPWQGKNNILNYFAVFKKIITAPTEVSWTKTTETATTTFNVGLYKAENFRVVSASHENGETRDFSASIPSSSTTESAVILLTAGADVVDGDVFNVVLATDNGGEVTVKVSILIEITVHFEKPARGKGSYTAIQLNNGNTKTCELSHTTNNDTVKLNNTNMFLQQLTATPADGYQFYRWVITDASGTTYPTTNPYNYTVKNGDKISVEFLPTGLAQFMVKDDPAQKLFYELDGENGAFKYAETLGKNVVVVHTSGTLYNEYKTPNTDGKYEFTIPTGYTLLVPGEATNKVATALTTDDMIKSFTGTPTRHKYLSLGSNIQITANGNICVYAIVSGSQGHNGKPQTYGEIAMGNGSEIIMEKNSILTVFGYITGDPTNSRVLAKDGSTVYEIFQLTDWRGGSQMMGGLVGNAQRVFPMTQFYIQNVETKLTLQYGAKEYACADVVVSIGFDLPVILNLDFITDAEETNRGFLRLFEGAELSKWYDGDEDITYLQLDKMENSSVEYAMADFGIVYADLPVAGEISSEQYVLSVPAHMNMAINSNVKVIVKYDMAFLAGASLTINKGAKVISQGNLFVYDKEWNTGYFAASGVKIAPITYTAYHYNKHLSNKTAYSYLSAGKPYSKADTYIRLADSIPDAKIVVDGDILVTTTDGVKDGSGFYTTTIHDANATDKGTSDNAADYGANITSTGGGTVDFQLIKKPRTTFQKKGTTTVTIPVTNARLRNEDGTYAAGDTMEVTNTYLYYKPNANTSGQWLIPTFGIPNATNKTFRVTLPNAKQQNVICHVQTAGITGVSISNFTNIALQADSRFAYTANSATYDPDNSQLIIPLIYTPVNIHNANQEPYSEQLTIDYQYTDPITGQNVSKLEQIDIYAVEDYTPRFAVSIKGADVTATKTHTFPPTNVLDTTPHPVVITPVDTTVASLSTINWTANAIPNPPFTAQLGEGDNLLSNAEVSYSPQAEGQHTGTLTITATYTDANSANISDTIQITLNGDADKQSSSLAFKSDLANASIYQGQSISDIFSNLGNGEEIAFIYEYTDGTDASALVQVAQSGDNYTLTAYEPTSAITEARQVIIEATQAENNDMVGNTITLTVTVLPPVIWNWSDLYFGQTYSDPVVLSDTTTSWTLTEKTDANNLITLSGSSPNYQAEVDNADPNQVYQAEFTFKQGTYTKDFTSNIYADPRILGYCVEYNRHFRGVSKQSETTAAFAEKTASTSPTTTFRPGDQWVINMIGVPDKLTFSATGNNTWYIGERASESINYSDVTGWTKLSGEQTYQLKPTTKQVIIQYGYGSDKGNGTITNLCISELVVAADQDVVYFPINKDGSSSSKKIVLTHTENGIPNIELDSIFTTSLSPVSDNLGSAEEPYYQTTLTISGTSATVTKGDYTLQITSDGKTITIPVYADHVPQGLPIQLASDDTKRFHFIVTKSDNVAWDATTREVLFQTPAGNQTFRSITFAFEGAPSRITFNASQDIEDTEWTISESVDGSENSFVVSGLANRDTESGGAFMHKLNYTTRYVRVTYNSQVTSEVALSDFVIEGDPMLLVNPDELEFSNDVKTNILTLTAINLNHIKIVLDNTTDFQMRHASVAPVAEYTLSATDYPDALGVNKVGDIVINTQWISSSIVNDGIITIYNVDDNDSILAKVKLVGAGKYLHKDDANKTGIYTGIPDGTVDPAKNYTFHGSAFADYLYHPVDLSNAFAADGTALFDYLFVFGETTTTDATANITAPSGENGSNARTPYYVYIRDVDAYGNFDRYRFVTMVDNANVGTKVHVPGVTTNDTTTYINVPKEMPIRVYITGFCPYASTGIDKYQEGVFFFRGMAGSKLDVYLEDAHIFARNKMPNGQPFYARGSEPHKQYNPKFTEDYARGSGGVLVFECVEKSENITLAQPFDVTIHTIGNNLLKSNYGCFNYFFGMDPFQISAPVHVRLHSAAHVRASKTTLNFTDEWPTVLNADRTVKTAKRTNGFLALRKLNNNAPSIDLGNPYTEVNFLGGQVELQNAQIVSTNYKTTLAISYRSGEYGGDKVGLKFAYGIGTDSVGGEINFYDGTITVLPMKVEPAYQQYYLMDPKLDAEGDTVREPNGSIVYTDTTTCLRTPKNTNVYGGSICWLRACQHVTSKGGAPSDGTGKLLGQYVYEFGEGDTKDDATGLVTSIKFPAEVDGLASYYDVYHPKKTYGIESVTPDENNKLYFWIPDGYGGVTPEKDNLLTTWKACMTEISAGFGTLKGTVGGPTPVEQYEEIKYMMYCKIDQNISNVITAGTGDGIDRVYSYSAPVKVPDVAQGYVGGTYTSVTPSMVGMETQNEVLSDTSYVVTDKVYYVTNATADVWETFTAPFDVEKVWVVETFSEEALKQVGDGTRDTILISQAHHNADFAAFFGVSMAIGTTDSLGTIFNDFIEWGKLEDQKDTLPDGSHKEQLYNGVGDYTLRGRYQLTPYYRRADGTANWDVAHFYLNENKGNWTTEDGYQFTTQWNMLSEAEATDGVLMEKGKTYSMLFPYCTGTGCSVVDRKEWDYWSGKFLIFESTDGTKHGGHVINGSNLFDSIPFNTTPATNTAIVSGNSTFSYLETDDPSTFVYLPRPASEMFLPANALGSTTTIYPTTAFLWANIQAPQSNMRVRNVEHSGKINYDVDEDPDGNQTPTGNMPTVGGGNDLFITTTANGINIAVAAPQHVRVLSSTGAVLFQGMVQTAVDVLLPTAGVYVITGENEVHKILH